MNRIFKVIWSKAKRCKVVVSEIAKSCTCVSKSNKRSLLLLTSLFLFSGINFDISFAYKWSASLNSDRSTYNLS